MIRCGEWAERFQQLVLRRLRESRQDGFILLESVIAITVITIVMGAVGAEFVGGMIITNQQRAQQGAVQVASSTVEHIRALDPSDLVTGRGSSSVDSQFASTLAALPAVQPWLSTMDKVSDPTGATTGGIAAAVPTCGTAVVAGTCQKTPGKVVYTVNQYLGSCSTATGVQGNCVEAARVTSRDAVKYLRAVVAVTWNGPRCGTACSFVTSTLISTASDPTFRINAAPYAAPIVVNRGDQTVVIGEPAAPLQMSVADRKGVPPFTWAVSAGSLPAGLVLNARSGLISGTATGPAGDYPSRIEVTDAFIRSAYDDVAWKVLPPLAATTPAAPTSVVSTPLSPALQLEATGGSGTYTWSDSSPRTLPAGLTLTSAGRISGTPTTVGSSTVILTVSSAGATRTVSFPWNVVRLAGASYDFEEGTGTTTADGTGNNNTATLQPGAGWTTGKVNSKALGLTGAGDSWAAAPNPVIDTSQSFTAATWVRFGSLGGYQTMVGVEGNSLSPFYLQKADDGRFRFAFYRSDGTSSSYGSVNGVAPTADAWYHVAGVFDQAAGTITLYVDGVSQGVVSGASMFRATGATTIGRAKFAGNNVDFLRGAVDDTRLYPRALTAAEIGDLASTGAAGPTGGSVDATGLTGPANRYSTSTTLNLALVKGSDPDGVASTGAQLFRATATLNSGTCGTYGTYTQVGTDNPATPFSTTVSDGACYRYRYRVVDNLGNSSSYESPDIKVDATPPTTAVTLSEVTGGAYKSGGTVFYRGVSAGSFRLSNAVTDAISGPASSQTAALGGTTTGWSHSPSTVSTPAAGPYASNPFSWTAGTASSPTETVTGRDAAGNSAGSALTFSNDSTAPSGGSISYPNGATAGRSVTVSFTPGSDSGSGIDSAMGRIKRSVAPLVNGVCGTTYVTNNDFALAPDSPFVDTTVRSGACYTYQYVVSDNVGNKQFYSSANVAKVDYASAVASTSGLLSRWRLGEAATNLLSADSFTAGANGALLSARAGETAAAWTLQSGNGTTAETFTWGTNARGQAIRRSAATGRAVYYTSATPTSANYRVEADVMVKSLLAGDSVGVVARHNTTTGSGYLARYSVTAGAWQLYSTTNGSTLSVLGTASPQALTAGQIYHLGLDVNGTTIRLLVDGVARVTATNTTYAAAGRGGVRFDGTAAGNATSGLHLDNFQMTPAGYPQAVDSAGGNTGDYLNGPTLGVPGAIVSDSDTAVQFDGVNDFVQEPFPVGLPVGSASRSVELWFKTSGTGRQTLFTYGSKTSNGGEFGLFINPGGTSMRAWAVGSGGPGYDLDFSTGSAVNDGAWHQAVVSYSGSALTLYVDGVSRGTSPAARSTVIDQYGFSIGGVLVPDDSNTGSWFNGSIDEVSFYTTALSQSVVTDHYELGTSPSP